MCHQILNPTTEVLSRMQNKNLIAFLAGAIAGGLATWLLLSDEGKELLNKIKAEMGIVFDGEEENETNETAHE